MSRLALAAFAVVLATVLVPLGITSSWLSLRVDSTDAYVDTVAPLADDDELRDRLGDQLATAATNALQDTVPVGLPASLQEVVRASTKMVVESDGFPEFWRKANADAHREFLSIVHERDQQVDDDGYVVVDLQPLLQQVIDEFAKGFPPAAMVEAPPLPLPVIPESKLEEARGGYQVVEALALWLPVLWVGLAAIAVLAARSWRGRLRVAAACAAGVAIGGWLVLLFTGTVTDVVVEQTDPDNQDLVRLVIEVVVSTLDGAAGGAVVGGLVVAAFLVGGSLWPGRRARPAHP